MEDKIQAIKKSLMSWGIGFIIPVIVGILCKIFHWTESLVLYSGIIGVIIGLKEFLVYLIDHTKFNGFKILTCITTAIGVWIGLFLTK